ncbi:ATP-dependent DNA ligase [Clavibacter tessellarius]|uniref:DUF7882 family protein n=1 Tax=Clavibacter tessellarius TaxID=31965 RepID=UPI0039BF35AB
MGQLIYDATTRTTIDDRALAHLQIVMLGKLRRKESFAFSWKYPAAEGDGRSTVWIAPESPPALPVLRQPAPGDQPGLGRRADGQRELRDRPAPPARAAAGRTPATRARARRRLTGTGLPRLRSASRGGRAWAARATTGRAVAATLGR